MTNLELMDRAAKVRSTEEADGLVQELLRASPDADEKAVRLSIGYFAGYLDRETAARILALFHTPHPYFGPMENWPKTPEEALRIGMEAAVRSKAGMPPPFA